MENKTVTEIRIGRTLYIVTSECSPNATETVEEKLERLILRHVADVEKFQMADTLKRFPQGFQFSGKNRRKMFFRHRRAFTNLFKKNTYQKGAHLGRFLRFEVKKNPTEIVSISVGLGGGATRNRTGDEGFADLCLTAWLWRHMLLRKPDCFPSELRAPRMKTNFYYSIHAILKNWSGRRGSSLRLRIACAPRIAIVRRRFPAPVKQSTGLFSFGASSPSNEDQFLL